MNKLFFWFLIIFKLKKISFIRIIGIDPGLHITGFGIIDKYHHQKLTYVTSGIIRSGYSSLPKRLNVLYHDICNILKEYHPHTAAIEKIFVSIVNPQSILKLGQARGTAICALANTIVSIHEYTPTQIKKVVVGYGHSQKNQIQSMVTYLLKLNKLPSVDAADALGIAICHANYSNRYMDLIKDKQS